MPHLSVTKRLKVDDLQRLLTSRDSSRDQSPSTTPAFSPQEAYIPQEEQRIKDELDDIVAAECVYCGEIVIRSIDKPFIDSSELEEVAQSWL